jgi:pimeloyl-ACP methyl ester carboxylesterase
LTKKSHVRLSDVRGASRLAIDATIGLANLVEIMHHNVSRRPGVFGVATAQPTKGVTGLVYRSIRGVTQAVGAGIDNALGLLVPMLGHGPSTGERESVLAALNGVLGDHLVESGNPLAVPMHMRRGGQALELRRAELAKAIPGATSKIVVLAHGLCMNDQQWLRKGHDHGEALERDNGFTRVYLQYNSGLPVATNGHDFAEMLDALLKAWPVPVEELVIIGHSMGGLVTRAAWHYGRLERQEWTRRLSKIVFLGTPHHGAPLERGGHWIDVILGSSPYTAAFARLGKIRSVGITDLRFGRVLDESSRAPVPLPEGVRCYAIAATLAREPGDLKGALLGDGLVPSDSALGLHEEPRYDMAFPKSRQWLGYGMGHMDLLDNPEVYEQIKQWLLPPV